jgi:hypothetical protein
MVAHSPRAFPWETKPPVGARQGTRTRRRQSRPRRRRRPRLRTCLRNGCTRKYRPRCYHQRYCQHPDCQRELNRWRSARRQAKRREDLNVKALHAQAEQARRQRVKSRPQPVEKPELAPPRGHTARTFFSWPLCDRPGCYQHRATSIRNQARYCCAACRQAVRNALDRERKWRSRGTLDGRKKRAIEYQAAQRRRAFRHAPVINPPPSRPPPE